MAKTTKKVPVHVLSRYEGWSRVRLAGAALKLARGHWPVPCGQRHGVGVDEAEVWTPAAKAFAKRELAQARRRAGKAEARALPAD